MKKFQIFAILALLAIIGQTVRPTVADAQNKDSIITFISGSEIGTLNVTALENSLFENVVDLAKSTIHETKKNQKMASKEMKRAMRLKKKYPDAILVFFALTITCLELEELDSQKNLVVIKESLPNLHEEHRVKIQKLIKEIDDRRKFNKTIISALYGLANFPS